MGSGIKDQEKSTVLILNVCIDCSFKMPLKETFKCLVLGENAQFFLVYTNIAK